MSGHSKWATIKHKKAKEDNKRGKVFTKLIREITVAAREGGGDINGNAKLRMIVDKAKAVNMPQDNIARAIKKGAGELGGASYEAATYEGYGPFGTAIMIETLSDNKVRTVSNLRHFFSSMGGSLAEAGAVAWMFEHKGVIRIAGQGITEDDVLEKMLDYDIDDVEFMENVISISCDLHKLDAVKKGAEKSGFKVEDAAIEWVPKTSVPLSTEQEEKAFKFLEELDELDDVQNVYSNVA